MPSTTPESPLITRRGFMAGAAAAAACAHAGIAFASTYPSRPIRVVVPFPPGGPTDLVARIVALSMSEQMGQSFVVENKGGASGMIGANMVAKAPSDGLTILMNVSAHVVNPLIYAKVMDDPLKDFTPITRLASTPIQLVVSAQSPFQTFQELVAAVQANPGKHTFASSSVGAPGHLTGELFKQATQSKVTHVPYKGSAPALTDVLGGQVSYMFDSMPSSIAFVQSGKLRALGVTADKRLASVPNVPTFAELGYPALNLHTWYGLWAPAKTPKPIVDTLYAAARKALQSPGVQNQLQQIQAYPGGETPAQFEAFCLEETKRYAEIVRGAGIKPE